MKKLDKLKTALMKAMPKDGDEIELGEDKFLTGMLDGSDKIYGFVNEGGEILVDAGGFMPYPVSDLDKEDVNYMLGSTEIMEGLKTGKYEKKIECDECGEEFKKSEIKTVMIPGIGKTLNETKVCPHCKNPISL